MFTLKLRIMKILRVLTAVLLLAVFAGLFKIKAAGKNALPDRSVKEPGPTVIAGTMAIAEILSDLEYKNVIGVPSSRHSLPELYKNTVKIGHPSRPDLETLKRLNADLFLTSLTSKPLLEKYFINQNIRSEFFDLGTYQACLDSIKRLGELTFKQRQAARVIQTIEAKVLELRRSIHGKKSPKVLMILGSPQKLLMGTRHCYTGSLMEALKIHNIAADIADFDKPYVPINVEEIIKRQPDIIIRLTYTKPEKTAELLRKEFAQSEIWNKVKAVQTNCVYDLDSELYIVSKNIKINNAAENLKELIYGTSNK